ncbi:hypothetical protein [Flavisolibacter ginsenosidimutans]|uniref:Uncharacterized protein n=1 Tax=Flavisolibacter ginsenosidimutans TaxID=661481 RepID=A0A5B8UL11_9BACT|nr:hypothetical protein [Flavisolibacter ginsenosidimutans]QEC56705.1 hypothetical protein FSB75_12620 [Flavisolibacter ginsenosidimutans]
MPITPLYFIQGAITIILSAIVAYLVSRSQKKLDYVYDFRKYILDKRKKIYDQIEVTISHLNTFRFDTLEGNHCHVFMLSADAAGDLERELVDLLRHSYWMSNEMAMLLSKVNLTFVQINSRQQHGDRPIDSWGKEFFQDFYKLGEELKGVYFFDVMHLNNLSLFKKSKSTKIG